MGYGTNNLNDYQRFTGDTAIYPGAKGGGDEAITYCILGLANEGGEVAGKWKKYIRDGQPLSDVREELLDEMGDVMWYIARLADELGVSLSDVVKRNEAKLMSRKERNVLGGSGDHR